MKQKENLGNLPSCWGLLALLNLLKSYYDGSVSHAQWFWLHLVGGIGESTLLLFPETDIYRFHFLYLFIP